MRHLCIFQGQTFCPGCEGLADFLCPYFVYFSLIFNFVYKISRGRWINGYNFPLLVCFVLHTDLVFRANFVIVCWRIGNISILKWLIKILYRLDFVEFTLYWGSRYSEITIHKYYFRHVHRMFGVNICRYFLTGPVYAVLLRLHRGPAQSHQLITIATRSGCLCYIVKNRTLRCSLTSCIKNGSCVYLEGWSVNCIRETVARNVDGFLFCAFYETFFE